MLAYIKGKKEKKKKKKNLGDKKLMYSHYSTKREQRGR